MNCGAQSRSAAAGRCGAVRIHAETSAEEHPRQGQVKKKATTHPLLASCVPSTIRPSCITPSMVGIVALVWVWCEWQVCVLLLPSPVAAALRAIMSASVCSISSLRPPFPQPRLKMPRLILFALPHQRNALILTSFYLCSQPTPMPMRRACRHALTSSQMLPWASYDAKPLADMILPGERGHLRQRAAAEDADAPDAGPLRRLRRCAARGDGDAAAYDCSRPLLAPARIYR